MIFSFVVPDPTASVTGGNLYNLGLTRALRAAGQDVTVVDLDTALRQPPAGRVFVDSLYLDRLPALAPPVHLLAHYLPSLVAHGTIPESVTVAEAQALAAAAGFLAPSDYMARALARLAPGVPTVVVEPGIEVPAMPSPVPAGAVRIVLVANLVAGKGVLPFLQALAPHLRDGAPLALTVIGSDAPDPTYAAACRAHGADQIHFAGPRSQAETLAAIGASDVLVSASRMESFGLALAEARALGVPIVARPGGNVAAHVDERAGGRLVPDDAALAAECAHLARNRHELARRRQAAQALRPPARSWTTAARELLERTSE